MALGPWRGETSISLALKTQGSRGACLGCIFFRSAGCGSASGVEWKYQVPLHMGQGWGTGVPAPEILPESSSRIL